MAIGIHILLIWTNVNHAIFSSGPMGIMPQMKGPIGTMSSSYMKTNGNHVMLIRTNKSNANFFWTTENYAIDEWTN
jgi:hypothetical protein